MSGRPERLDGVQYLRALAAVAVMVSHTMGDMIYHGGPLLWRYYYVGAAGVDLFFVISGFVMIYAAHRLFGTPGGAVLFLRKRLARIVPLYWVATLVYGLVQIGQGKWSVVRPDLVAASLAFWPYSDGEGLHLPVYSIGWTLDYEMFFYVVFAAGLLVRRRLGLALIAGGLLGLVLTGTLIPLPQPLRFWSQPVLIDFVLGLAVGLVYLRGWRLPRRVAPLLGLAALAFFAWGTLMGYNAIPNVPEAVPRWIVWGVPATLAFAATVLPVDAAARPRPWLAHLGDSSYAIYLVHVLVIIGLRPLLPWLEALMPGSEAMAGTLQLLCTVAVVLALASMIHLGFERPVARLLQRRRRGPSGAEHPGPALA